MLIDVEMKNCARSFERSSTICTSAVLLASL
jgi:hypothetical protein